MPEGLCRYIVYDPVGENLELEAVDNMSIDNEANEASGVALQEEEVCIAVRSLWKVFGDDPSLVMSGQYVGKSKAEIQEELNSVIALQDVSFDVYKGETFVVMGLSGSGKSTLVRCLTRLIEPDAGHVYVDEEDVIEYSRSDLTKFRRTKTAMVFQYFGLMPNRTILDNVAFGLEIQGVEKEARHQKAREVLENDGIKGWEDNYAFELSGGMQQRVGLARALAVDPEILLMDEPFSALDPLIRREMQEELLVLQKTLKKTIVFITHDLDEALRMGSRIAIMRDGMIVQLGSPEEIVENPSDDYVGDFVRSISRTRVLGAASIMDDPSNTTIGSEKPSEVLAKLSDTGEEFSFVLDSEGKIVGVVTLEDVSSISNADDSSIEAITISDAPVFSKAYPDTPINELVPLSAMSECPIAVVDDEDRLLGVVSRGDLLVSLAESHQAQQAEVVAAGY